MREKILKIETLLLFLFSLLSFPYFYFQNSLPDHFLSISSNNASINFFSYGLTSLAVGAEYFTGTWLIFPLIFFSMVYGLLFARREYLLDLFLFFPIVSFFLMLSYLFYPVMLGQGLFYLLHENIPPPYSWGVLVLSLLTIVAGCFRTSLRERMAQSWFQMTNFLTSLMRMPSKQVGEAPTAARPSLQEMQKMEEIEDAEIEDEDEETTTPLKYFGRFTLKKQSEAKRPLLERRARAIDKKNSSPAPKELIDCLAVKETEKSGDPKEIYFQLIIEKIEDKLAEFNVDAKIINILKGPVVDTFELELGEGVRVARVTSLSEDLSLALSGSPLRIIYPMKGKTTVGIEVPRTPRNVILLHEVLNSKDFQNGPQNVPLAMGKNAFGDPCIVDLTKMPHMLVAGATGAGKSVFLNTLLLSMLIKMSPRKLKLLLIDPKQLELTLYRDLPHLAMPVITDPSQAAIALLWAVEEMERRYTILSKLEVRSIDNFNAKIKDTSPEQLSDISHLYEGMGDAGYELPYLVIVIDEFADLVLVKNGKTIENNICRLAAKARACGIHLIIATQRPSVDVITGLIKANFPTRVSFRVTAGQDSRTILNSIGAENLLGRGDMLYKHGIEMRRLHAAYVSDEQISQVMSKIATGGPVFLPKAIDYLQSNIDEGEMNGRGRGDDDDNSTPDPLYDEAVKIVLEHRMASASMIQRRLKVGYNRAANLIEIMENCGVVGPQQGPKPREVLGDPRSNPPEQIS